MSRTPLLALSLAVFGLPVPAQGDLSKQILGTWQGPYQSESVPPGALKLVVAKENAEWKVTLEISADDPPPAGEVREFKVENGEASWVQTVADMECRSIAKLVEGALKGGAECSQGGAVVVTATFVLIKQG